MRNCLPFLALFACSSATEGDSRLDALEAAQATTDLAMLTLTARVDALEDDSPGDDRDLTALATRVATLEAIDHDAFLTDVDLAAADYATSADLEAFETLVLVVEANLLVDDQTINIPAGDAQAVRDTLDDLTRKRIAPSATITLDLPAGTWVFDDALTFTHPDGGQIVLHGAGSDLTILQFPLGDGVIVLGTGILGGLDSLSLAGGGGGTGLLATSGGLLQIQDDVLVDGFDTAISAQQEALVLAVGIQIGPATSTGVSAEDGGVVDVRDAVIYGDDMGIYATDAAYVRAEGAVLRGHMSVGAWATDGSVIDLQRSEIHGADTGVLSTRGSFVRADDALIDRADTSGTGSGAAFEAQDGGVLYVASSDVWNMTTGVLAESGAVAIAPFTTMHTVQQYAYQARVGSVLDASSGRYVQAGAYALLADWGAYLYAPDLLRGSTLTGSPWPPHLNSSDIAQDRAHLTTD
jgi:hypothetical protein